MVKRITSIAIGLLITVALMAQKDSDVLVKVGDDKVTVSEFKYIYEKNNRDEADYSKKSISEYLDLYTNFKLKVARAKALGLHQDEMYQQELEGYRKKLADSYILDKEVNDQLVDDILARKKYDVKVSHVLLPIKRDAPEAAMKVMMDRADKVAKELKGGKAFEEVAKEYSGDKNSAASGGDIGYMTSMLPDGYVELENAMYDTKVGAWAGPIRTDLGLHFVKVTDRRPARGKMEAQHILIRSKKYGKPVENAKTRIDTIYSKLTRNPENFDLMAYTLSEDKATKNENGSLGVFGMGQYEQAFEDAAFALSADGQISAPVETSVGWHIIKRVAKKAPDSRERIRTIIKDKLNTGERFNLQKAKVVAKLKKELGFKEYPENLMVFKDSLNRSYLEYNWPPAKYEALPLMTIKDKTYTIEDFVRFNRVSAKLRLLGRTGDVRKLADYMYDEFVQDMVITYMETQLEDRYPEFRNLLREYQEGILLFEVSKKEIWDRATKDTTGLKAFYEGHKDNYLWKPRAVLNKYMVRSTDYELIKKIQEDSKTMSSEELLKKYNLDGKELMQAESSIVERTSELLRGMPFTEGSYCTPKIDQKLKASTFHVISETLPARHKTLKESRGYVISDYQEQLEKDWLTTLKEQYPIKINKRVLKKLYK